MKLDHTKATEGQPQFSLSASKEAIKLNWTGGPPPRGGISKSGGLRTSHVSPGKRALNGHGELIAMHSARLRADVSLANKNKY
jgi:hypothetical protein